MEILIHTYLQWGLYRQQIDSLHQKNIFAFHHNNTLQASKEEENEREGERWPINVCLCVEFVLLRLTRTC